MKKSLLLVSILILIIATLPMIGNIFLKQTIDEELQRLNSSEFKILKDETDSSYLTTRRHLEVDINNNNSKTTFGFDIEYNNLPFTKALTIDAYPLSLPSTIDASLQKRSPLFYKELNQFLKERAFLYQIKYNLIDQKFKASFKDIDQLFHLDNNATFHLFVKKAKSSGHLLKNFRPDEFNSQIDTLSLKFISSDENVLLSLSKLAQKSSFEILDAKINSYSSTSIGDISVESKKMTFDMKDMKMKVSLTNLDETLYERFSTIKSEAQAKELFTQVLAKGLELNIENFQVKHIFLDKQKDLKGFKMSLKMDVKKDALLVSKLKISPLLALTNLNIETTLRVSNEIYAKLKERGLIRPFISSYFKQEKRDMSLDLKYIDSKISLNGKQIN